MKKKYFERKTLEEQGLPGVPEFYKSLTQNPSTVRLRGMDVKKRVPTIDLFIEGTLPSASFNSVEFGKVYKKVPLVTGLVIAPSGVATRVYPDGYGMIVNNDGVIIPGAPAFPVTAGSIYRLKVYNLDLEE